MTQQAWPRFAVPFAAGLTLLGFTFVNFLNYNSYPLLRPEVGYFYAGLVVLCASMAALYNGQRSWGRAFLEALLVAAVVDMNLDSLWLTGAAFVASFAFVIWKRTSLLPFAALMGAVMLVIAVVGIGQKRNWIETRASQPTGTAQQTTAPAIVHLILDEQIGVEGLPNNSPSAAEMKDDLREFYSSHGFATFGRAYSEHYYTANSIPEILNLGGPLRVHGNPKHLVFTDQMRYFDALRQQGYKIIIYQNRYLNTCASAAPVSCTTYNYSSMRPLLQTSLSIGDLAQLILFKFLALSDVLAALESQAAPHVGELFPFEFVHPPLNQMQVTSPIASLTVMDRMSSDLRHAKPGEIYFAHLLVPHMPFLTDRNCKLRTLRNWDSRVLRIPPEQRSRAYFDQVRCTLKKVDELLQSLASSPASSNSIVIIHGDHGSRLWENIPDKRFYRFSTDADYVAGFSTLFAVRSPQIGTAYVEQPAPVADLLRQLVESRFTKLPKPPPGPPMVWLADEDWHPWKRVEMPESWWKNPAVGSSPAHN